MGNSGHTAQGTRGTTRPRVYCPACKRSIAVTIHPHTGASIVRTHVTSPGDRCRWSGREVPRDWPHHEKGGAE